MKVCLACGHRFTTRDWRCPVCHHQPQALEGHLAFAPELAAQNDGYEAAFFPLIAALEAQHFWFRSRNRLINWALQRYFPNAKQFLEIGCGTGFVLSGIERANPHLTLSASEIFTTGLSFAAERVTNVELFQMDARQIPFEAEFDVIGAFDVLEHIQADTEVLAQMYQATRSGGGVIITVPQHPWLWSQFDERAHHVRRYQAQELQRKVQQAGFKVIHTTSFISLLLPLLLLSRLRPVQPQQTYDVTTEFKISRWLNTILEQILKPEHQFIQWGVRFPAGGSLLLVARK
jgi:SAM-dependent methyltransferase